MRCKAHSICDNMTRGRLLLCFSLQGPLVDRLTATGAPHFVPAAPRLSPHAILLDQVLNVREMTEPGIPGGGAPSGGGG